MSEAFTIEKILEIPWVMQAFKVILILAFGWILSVLLRLGIDRFEKSISKADAIRESGDVLRLKTFSHLVKGTGTVLVWLCVVYMLLGSFGVNVAPLLAGAGVVGLAFGFGGQYLIRDIINGIFILIEGQFRINDVVKIGEFGGLVEAVNLRHTKLRDLEGRVIYIPNGEIKTVVNFTKEYSRALLSIGVAYETDIDHAIRVIRDLGAEMRKDSYFGQLILDDLEMLAWMILRTLK